MSSQNLFSRTAALLAACALALPAPTALARTRPEPKAAPAAIAYSAYNGHPKLVVIIVIDQFRGDYLDRYHADFKGRGFRLFLDHGAYFPDCYYDYANTKTAPGHATLGTGAYTDGHGIASNEWWDLDRNKDRPISSVEDERYRQVGAPAPPSAKPSGALESMGAATNNTPSDTTLGASPRNLLASTIGDELRLATQGQSKVYGISLKDRAAILPAGAAANAAFWIDQTSGYFVTSTYYASQLPAWATAFNTSPRIQQAFQDAQSEQPTTNASQSAPPAASSAPAYPGKGFYGVVGSTPAANSYELDFAKALIQGEQLGTHPTTDLITISLSANDIMGHQTGPDSTFERQMVDGLDTDLDSFFTWLDKNVEGGLPNVWVALSADHGIAPIPAEAAKLGIPAANVSLAKILAALNDAMNLKFSPGENVSYFLSHQEMPYIALNSPAFERDGINETEAEEAVQRALPAAVESLTPLTPKGPPSETRLPPSPILFRSFTRLQLQAGEVPPTDFGHIIAHSYSPNGGWYVMAIYGQYQMEQFTGATQTNHFTPWSYDRHVPLGFYGAPFTPGIYRGRVAPVDLAATLASVLGINQPSASVGHILTQALRPDAAITYPKPAAPKLRRRHSQKAATTPDTQPPSSTTAPAATPAPAAAAPPPVTTPPPTDPQAGKKP